MDFASLEELKQKLKKISEKGFIKSHRSNNTGIGKTLEDEMGISENNLPEHDFTIGKTLIELKAQRIEAGTPVTLSTKEPTWKINKFDMIRRTGYLDKKGRQALKIILSTRGYNPKGFKLKIRGIFRRRIAIIHHKLGEVCFFDYRKLMGIIRAKLGENILLVLADVKKKADNEYFNYKEALYLSGFKPQEFKKMIKDGRIIWEFRLHLKSDNAIRDHGSGFRTARKNLSDLYQKEINLI